MTCIVGMEHGGRVYMAGDRGYSAGDEASFTSTVPKVYSRKIGSYSRPELGSILMAAAGTTRCSQILRFADLPPYSGEGILEYLSGLFMDEVRKALEKGVGTLPLEEGIPSTRLEILVGFRGELWEVGPCGAVTRCVSGYSALGSGAMYALGAMHASRRMKNAKARLKGAVAAAIQFSPRCKGPIDCLNL